MPRLTSHGEVVFQPSSNGRTVHPFWGPHTDWWPGPAQEVKAVGCGACQQSQQAQQPAQQPAPYANLNEWFDAVATQPSDFNEHMPALRDLASRAEIAIELSSWFKPALLAMAAGKPKKLLSVCPGPKPIWPQIRSLLSSEEFDVLTGDPLMVQPVACDLLMIDTMHQAERLYQELSLWAPLCRHWIAVHCTVLFGERGDNGGPGVLVALRRWVREHPEWSVLEHYPNNHGLTVLTCRADDKPQLPNTVRQAWNFGKAMAKWKVSGLPVLDEPCAEARLQKCDLCKHRTDERCSVCGCPLLEGAAGVPGKAFVPTEACPLGHWHAET